MEPTGSAPPLAVVPPFDKPFDQAALEELFVLLEKRLFNVVYRWLWNAEDADDVVQETFMKLWAKKETVRTETAQALAFRVAVNLAASKRRSKKLWGFVSFDADDLAPAPTAPRGDQAVEERRVRAAIDRLPEKLRVVVVLAELSGLSYAEIAALLAIPEGTVASRRHQGLAQLKTALQEKQEKTS